MKHKLIPFYKGALMKGYSNKQIAEIIGLTPRMIQFCTQEGIVTADVDKGKGRGSVRRYSEENLFEFALVSELSTYGIKITSIRHIIQGMEIKKRKDFFEILEKVKPLLILKIRDSESDFGEVKPVIQMSFEDESKSRNLSDLLEQSVSVLTIDLFQLYQRKCLGVVKPVVRYDDVNKIENPEFAEVAKLFQEVVSEAGKRKIKINDLMIDVLKNQRKQDKK